MHKKLAPAGEIPTGALLGEKGTGTSRGPAGLKQVERPGRTGSTAAPPFPHKKPKTPARRSWLYGHCMLSRRERTNPLPTEKQAVTPAFSHPARSTGQAGIWLHEHWPLFRLRACGAKLTGSKLEMYSQCQTMFWLCQNPTGEAVGFRIIPFTCLDGGFVLQTR